MTDKLKTFVISCSTSNTYWLTVQAPSDDAVRTFYRDESDDVEFHKGGEDSWEVDDIYEEAPQTGEDAPRTTVDYILDEDGKVVSSPTTEKPQPQEEVPLNEYTLGCSLLYGLELAQDKQPSDPVTSQIQSMVNGGPGGSMVLTMKDGSTYSITCQKL